MFAIAFDMDIKELRNTYQTTITTSVIASMLSPMFFLIRNLEESGKEVIFANRKEKGKINMEVNMTEQNKQYRLTSLEEPTDEMLFELMAGVENIAKISSAKAEAEKKRRLQAVAEEILAWRANQ